MKQKSLYTEIIEEMEAYLKRIDSGEDGHFTEDGGFKSKRSAARYAVANMIGYAKATKGLRELDAKDKLKRKQKAK